MVHNVGSSLTSDVVKAIDDLANPITLAGDIAVRCAKDSTCLHQWSAILGKRTNSGCNTLGVADK